MQEGVVEKNRGRLHVIWPTLFSPRRFLPKEEMELGDAPNSTLNNFHVTPPHLHHRLLRQPNFRADPVQKGPLPRQQHH